MSRATPDDQLKFLLSCVKFSNNGKIDFVEVAKECNVVSKGAAAKRYERLLKANGIQPGGGTSTEKQPSDTTPRIKRITKSETGGKKRRLDYTSESYKHEGENDAVAERPAKNVKREREDMIHVHEQSMNSRGSAYGHYLHPPPPFLHGPMSAFLHPTMRPPSQYAMMPPPNMQYGHISNGAPNHPFMIPQHPMPNFSMPHTSSSSCLHDPKISSSALDGSYHPMPTNEVNIESLSVPYQSFLDTSTLNNSTMTSHILDPDKQSTSVPSSDSEISMKNEYDCDTLPASFQEYLVADVKVEVDGMGRDDIETATTEASASTSSPEVEQLRAGVVPTECEKEPNDLPSSTSAIKKEEILKAPNNFIFISD